MFLKTSQRKTFRRRQKKTQNLLNNAIFVCSDKIFFYEFATILLQCSDVHEYLSKNFLISLHKFICESLADQK